MSGPADKYSFTGIGTTGAMVVLAVLAANPSTTWLTTGVMGAITKWILSTALSMTASMGLVIMNVGAEQVELMIDQHNYDGSFESALKLVDAAHAAHQTLTPDQIKAIDDPVIAAFRNFASFARQKGTTS